MKDLVFDIETDGLLPTVSKIHCGAVLDLETGELTEYGPKQVGPLLAHLRTADRLIGHNICGYDMLVLQKLHGYPVLKQKYIDTLSMSQSIFPGSKKKSRLLKYDFAMREKFGESWLEAGLMGRHSLKAWSARLKLGEEGKAEYSGGFEKWSQEMQDYNTRDVRATARLYAYFRKRGWPDAVFELESMMLYLVEQQKQIGVGFNQDAAICLLSDLSQQKADLLRQLQSVFPPIQVKDGPPKVWARDMVCRKYKPGEEGYFEPRKKGESVQKWKTQEFNPGSEPQVAARLIAKYNWEPQHFTPGGQPQVTEEILGDLPYPEAKLLCEYAGLEKILGYLSEGKGAWLQVVKDGRIHGSVYPLGATTHRASHDNPNLANVPSADKPIGHKCRALFRAGGGGVPMDFVMVGCDATSIQLAIYAHYVAKYDGGEFAKIVGDPKGDPHEYMRKASGLFTRNRQKTFTYATWLGAGRYKQGLIALTDWREAIALGLTTKPAPALERAAAFGGVVNKRLRTKMAGYEQVQNACDEAAKRGYVTCLDGRRIAIDSGHLALGALLQGNEAVIMKRAYQTAWLRLEEDIRYRRVLPMLWVHDEFQWGTDPDYADTVGKVLADAIVEAGASLNMRLPLRAQFKVGETWAATH